MPLVALGFALFLILVRLRIRRLSASKAEPAAADGPSV
jgi:hypothetical protein